MSMQFKQFEINRLCKEPTLSVYLLFISACIICSSFVLWLWLCDTNARTYDYISETDGDSLSLMGGTKNLFYSLAAVLNVNFYENCGPACH